ncbi:MAG TPA: TetR/AcrR family transcriptional regulator [Steroidobacteraceae bacterium]|nr:TetR/AcrR family transcriptional regulator [Steroidobacteraceae bacterium]
MSQPPVAARSTSKDGSKLRQGPGRPTLSNEELLDKAVDLFLEKGFERTTIDAITASAGMAKRTVYLRYGDKTALFKAALQRAIEEWIVPVERLRAAESDDVEDTLLRAGQILVENLMSPAGLRLLRLTNAESARMPEIGAYTTRRGTEPTIAYLADLIQRRIPFRSDIASPEEAAFAFLYLVACGPATMAAWGLVLDKAAIDRHTQYCVRLFLYGLLPRERSAAARRGNGAAVQAAHPGEEIGTPRSRMEALEIENQRLKKLLLDSMLQVAALRERQGGGV